jgi:hypothetical protein
VGNPTPHIVRADCDTILGGSGAVNCPEPSITHADGTLVGTGCGYALNHPAEPGETIVIYAVGLSSTNPPVKTGDAAPSPGPTMASTSVPMFLSFLVSPPPSAVDRPSVWSPANGPVYPEYVGLVPNYVGLYQINLKVPGQLPPNSVMNGFATVRFRMGVGDYTGPSDGTTFADICVQAQVKRP